MTQALAGLLADIDDPELVERILTELDVDAPPSQSSDQPHRRSQSQSQSLEDWFDRYLKRRRSRSPATRAQYKRVIPGFIDFGSQHDVSYPGGLSTQLVEEYVDMLLDTYDKDATIFTHTKNVQAWLRWLADRSACGDSLHKLLSKDALDLSPTARDVALPVDEAEHLLRNLRRQRFGSPQHAVLELAWNSGLRLGGLHSLDLDDLDTDNNDLMIRHRPAQGTRLKNGKETDNTAGNGERDISIHSDVVAALQGYIQCQRPNITDEFGREPLFATKHGRAGKSTLRRWIYKATSCRWATDGPADADTSCDGSCHPDTAVCPFSYYPHAVRRGAIVAHLSGGLRRDRASQRFNVSVKVLEKHYDPRTPQQRKADREDAVKKSWNNF